MVKEVDESAPPPAPPLSPPPVIETTTIGKYIARFRYEKPLPREARAAAQQSDFWWTKSPRYSRSPSPPSTWASGGVFAFPNEDSDEEGDRLEAKTEEEPDSPAEDDRESVDSIESKLRQRLGLWSSKSSQVTRKESSPARPLEVLQSWVSMDWGSVDLEEMEEDNEDPEEVIERVRRRLGWGATTPGISSSTVAKLKPIEFRLSLGATGSRDPNRRQLGMKPPLSPGFMVGTASDSADNRSILSQESMGRERGNGSGRFEEVSSIGRADEKDPSVVNGKEDEKQSPVDEQEEKISVHGENVSLVKANVDRSVHGALPSADIAAERLRSSSSSVDSHTSQTSEPRDNTLVMPTNEDIGDAPSTSPLLGTSEKLEAETQTPNQESEHDAADAVAEPPLLPTASPVRPDVSPELVLPPSNVNASERSQNSSSSDTKEELTPTETTKTLDNLVSLVVHSWGNDFFSTSESKEGEPTDTREQVTESREDSNGSNEDRDPITMENTGQKQPDPDTEEKEDVVVPGEEDDQIVQMLLGRIALLEEALHQIDS
ncbi:hypothetical protein, variant [Phytophthora nicotianae INRA-310]|uniref:Uncharacterized protein n=1 Tax=Phytophthora nicotianae (strain INRA-310) TaxID=761204 RepID=W2Q4N6_PHYN3|nr:hypothetical protein PPTG_13115 [Phytophthora nicotianae INRA-310]XP_008907096.1 hypothetical protein, variant [Phytophthora nicotianae INRA-310]ETN07810.1 hypothetical protein PPTG_13115 [Phytophthora nicotianae INRA-310]ETN07811.1 hypothetical protein, variant [Phytophthora nicotianae INRA-310]